MHGITKDGEALAHCVQENRLVIHLHLDEVGRDKTTLVLDSNVQVVWWNICPNAVRAEERRM